MKFERIKTSFKDPDGFVFNYDGNIYRCIRSKSYIKYIDIFNNSFFNKLFEKNKIINSKLVDNKFYLETDEIEKSDKIVFHEKIIVNSNPCDWPFDQLKDAAIFHLDLEILLLDNGYCLKDASARNIMFKDNNPLFIDLLSIEKYLPNTFWRGQMQFYYEFLNPLLLKSYFDIDYNSWYKSDKEGIKTSDINKIFTFLQKIKPSIFFHVFLPSFLEKKEFISKEGINKKKFSIEKYKFLLKSLKKIIKKLKLKKIQKKKEWSNYLNFLPYNESEMDKKKKIIKFFLENDNFKNLIDLGCNDGVFIFLPSNKSNLVGYDINHECINKCYLQSKTRKENCIFKVKNLSELITGNKEIEEIDYDACISLALVHHLRISCNIPLNLILKFILSLSKNGIIEFIDKKDEQCEKLLNLKIDTYDDYYLDNLLKILKDQNFKIKKISEIKKNKRFLIEYEKNQF